MDAEHPRATIDADAAETFVHLYGEDNSEPDVKSILLFSTSTSMTCEEAQVSPMIVVRYATKPVVCIYYDDITETQAAYPEIVQPGSDSMIYLINTSDKVATVYLNGTLAEDQLVESRASRPGARLDVAPQGGLYAVSVADLDFSRPVVLKWDIDGDPKVVVMRPPTPPT
ncbi:hypothetical protein G6O69_36210 [Pseudenhygromyxa sp. WMMC2535]|uniref:hypothetical protein n=1 Tax=Pseudenhygromyxa sp. WMMC2535 TaxID=2712867 RepID=UPI0015956473|nr:hypothetical protein [Pseudenhygromyxa sp. WMMC2535]NVB43326.1 hypothetical protein [Pseudenhygromyxa sp. WMMC2535]